QKVKFKGELNNFERRNLVFEKIKKLKRGTQILEKRLMEVNDQLINKATKSTTVTKLPISRPVWGEEKSSSPSPIQNENNYKIIRMNEIQFGVGLNTYGNDQLRGKWANKDDYWLHLEGLTSAHVVIKLPSNKS